MLASLAISGILLTINLASTSQSRFVMAIVCVSYMTGIMARNAMSPRLVFVLSTILSLPTAYGLVSLHNDLAYWTAALIAALPFYMSQIAYSGRHETVTAHIQAEAAERLANFDVLTGLPNRHFVNSYLREQIRILAPEDPLFVLLLDIDKFKDINDSRGHPTGDELLVQAGARIAAAARRLNPLALTARLGGDEFVVITNHTGEETAAAISREMQKPFELNIATIATSCSIGVKRCDHDDDEIALLKGADLALYAAKQAGRRRWKCYEPSMQHNADRAIVFEERFRRALSRNELHIAYQPVIELASGRAVSCEALARWRDDQLGEVSPVEFIPFAEESGLIDELTLVLLVRACSEVNAFDNSTALAFNVSVAEFARPDRLVETISRAIDESGLAAGRLWIEITEGILIADFETVLSTLQTIRRMGVHIALDDFGSGYSSLSYLEKLSGVIDAIKLDKSIVNDAMSEGIHEIIVKMVAQIANQIGAKVVVEGIETEQVATRMKQLGATHAQGYYFGKPGSLLSARLGQWTASNLQEQTAPDRNPKETDPSITALPPAVTAA
ncbi:MAG: putative bifunctional diguanylate cyclase/phosphodiesterase [Rhodoblastus sp.]